jgi:hypothetical protein
MHGIVTVDAGGSLPTATFESREATWSPVGADIAFVVGR